jgi:hypothetical protein
VTRIVAETADNETIATGLQSQAKTDTVAFETYTPMPKKGTKIEA